ncbi:MAG: class I SAM-dependent methyltransferase [Candidatus Hermodarchaeota archaeon]
MSEEMLNELDIDYFRSAFNKYTREAFIKLPKMDKPRILDIGCGTGVPTMELAKLSDGEIIGIDIDQKCLDRFNKKIEKEGLANRVKAIKCTLLDIKFPDNSFDVIWAEGTLTTLGVEKSLIEWKIVDTNSLNTSQCRKMHGGKNIINRSRVDSKYF